MKNCEKNKESTNEQMQKEYINILRVKKSRLFDQR